MTEPPRSIPCADGLSKRNGAGYSGRARSFVHRMGYYLIRIVQRTCGGTPSKPPFCKSRSTICRNSNLGLARWHVRRPDVFARVGLIDRSSFGSIGFGVSDRSAQDRSQAKPDEVVRTPVTRLRGRAATRATNAYAVRAAEIV